MYLILIAIVIIIVIYLSLKWNKLQSRAKSIKAFQFEYSQLSRIIDESIKIINQTKNIETGISRFDVIKEDVKRIIEIAPQPIKFSISLPENQDLSINTLNDLNKIDETKKIWIRLFFRERITTELQKANLLSDVKLKTIQLKKALNVVLKAIEYIPEDQYIKESITGIEQMLSILKSSHDDTTTTLN